MAGRGRGRGRGANDGLKGVTWDFDPTLKLDAKPTDLYPVCFSFFSDPFLANILTDSPKY